MWVPFLRPFPGNEAHKLFFWGPTMGRFGWGQKVYVEKVYVPFLSLNGCGRACRVHAKGVVLSEKTCFCLRSYHPNIK